MTALAVSAVESLYGGFDRGVDTLSRSRHSPPHAQRDRPAVAQLDPGRPVDVSKFTPQQKEEVEDFIKPFGPNVFTVGG